MKRIILAALALALVSLAGPASAASFVLWEGDVFVTAVNDTTACGNVGMHTGDFARGVLRPKVVNNGTADLFAWYFGRASGQISPVGNAGRINGATTVFSHYVFASAGFYEFVGANAQSVSGATFSPISPVLTTANVAIAITINDIYSGPAGPSGCNVTFTGSLAKRPI